MTQAFGFNSFLGWGEESVYGTEVARTKFGEYSEDTLKAIRERSDAVKFRGRSKNLIVPGKSGAAGTVGIELHYEGMELLLKHLMGSVATTDVDVPNSVKNHDFELEDLPPTGLSMEVYRGAADAVLYTGCKINSGTIVMEQDAIATMSLDVIAKQEDNTETASTPSFPSYVPILWTHVKLEWGSVEKEVQRFEISINQNLDPDRRKLGDREILEPFPSDRREVTGQFEMFFEDEAEYDDFLAETERALVVTAEGAAISPSASKYTFIVDCQRAILTGETPAPDGPGGFSVVLPFEAYAEAVPVPTFEAVKLSLINQTASV